MGTKRKIQRLGSVMTRKKLKKYLGKALRYEAKVAKRQGTNILFVDIKLNGKRVVDHFWCSQTLANECLVEGEVISFIAKAQSYRRRDGTRDYTLTDCHSFRNTTIMIVANDDKYAKRRKTK